MSIKSDLHQTAKVSTVRELKDVELAAVSAGKKISVAEAVAQPGFAIGPAIYSK